MVSCSTTECSELTADKIVELKIVDDSMETIVVTGVRLGKTSLSNYHLSVNALNELQGKIPKKLFNKYQEALNQALKEFTENLKACFLEHFPGFVEESVELQIGTVGVDYQNAVYDPRWSTGVVTFDPKSMESSATTFKVDLYTFTQNVLLHEWETHLLRFDYILGEPGGGNPIGMLEFDWERDAQENTYNTWKKTLRSQPPKYYIEQDLFESTLSALIEEFRDELGDEYSDWSDDEIQAQFTDALKAKHAENIKDKNTLDLLNSPMNGKYKDNEHALEPCEQLQPDE